ncbi:MAG: AAA family ATPase, partial [Candidatus Hydrothermarchaeota archaeon]
LNQLLTEMDGVEELNKVVVIAATNRPDLIDPALLRPGRLDRLLLVPVPDEEARGEIFKVHTKHMPLDAVDLDRLAKQTDGYVGADIEALCREAGMLAIRETLAEGGEIEKKKVAWQHFSEAMKKVKPSVNKDVMTTYERLLKRFETKEMERPDLVYTG